jgi:hypothetical protein
MAAKPGKKPTMKGNPFAKTAAKATPGKPGAKPKPGMKPLFGKPKPKGG